MFNKKNGNMLRDLPPTMLRNRTPFQTPFRFFNSGVFPYQSWWISFHVGEEIDISDGFFSKNWKNWTATWRIIPVTVSNQHLHPRTQFKSHAWPFRRGIGWSCNKYMPPKTLQTGHTSFAHQSSNWPRFFLRAFFFIRWSLRFFNPKMGDV